MLSRYAIATVGAIALGGLTACGDGDEAFRTGFRTQALANCQRGAAPEVAAQLRQMGTTAEQLCTCGIDRYMRGASMEQLRQDRNNPEPPALRNAMMQCMADHVERSGAMPMGAAPVAPGAVELDRARAQVNSAIDQARSEMANAQAEMERAMQR